MADHGDDIKAARLAQTDERIANLKAELKELTEKRKAYLPASKKD